MNAGLIDAEHLTKVYGTATGPLVALADVSFTIEEGEFISLVGPSGRGKSTLLSILGGLEERSGAKDMAGKTIGLSDLAGGEVPMTRASIITSGLKEGSDVKLVVAGEGTLRPCGRSKRVESRPMRAQSATFC